MPSSAEVLSDEYRALLRHIEKEKPASLTVLADLTGRKPSNLSRTLKTLANYGVVEIHREKKSSVRLKRQLNFAFLRHEESITVL